MSTATLLPEQLVYLVIRFAISIPDHTLPIHTPQITTTLSLKQLLRPHLPFDHARARLRLIYAGKVLADTTPLSVSLRLPLAPPPRDRPNNAQWADSKGKGKEPIREGLPASGSATIPLEARRYYVHCSLGDALSPVELASEATLAETTESSLRAQYPTTSSDGGPSATGAAKDNGTTTDEGTTTTIPAPQGFDRLLSTGFSLQEVALLRSQFQTNYAYTHTPDTMPTPAEMRALEDRWLDSTATNPSSALTGEGDPGWGAGFAVEEGGLDDMLWGYLTGFFWPLGALVWGFREEGVWSRRRQLAVVMGVVLNAAFGFMRWSQ